MITVDFELSTTLSNLLIFIVSIILFFKTKRSLWKLFFFCTSIDALLGVIVHGVSMSIRLNVIMWIVLSFFFTITINTLLCIFLKLKFRHIIFLSILLFTLLGIQLYFAWDFLLTFLIYAVIVLLICTHYILRSDNKLFYLLAFVVQIIGGILLLLRVDFGFINYNGICHVASAIALFLLYFGSKKDIKI